MVVHVHLRCVSSLAPGLSRLTLTPLLARPLVVMFIMSAVVVEVWPTQMPIWALFLALLIAAFYIIPLGMIQAITNQQIGLNVITELIVGYALPGKPLAMMLFKTYGYIVSVRFLPLRTDLVWGRGRGGIEC